MHSDTKQLKGSIRKKGFNLNNKFAYSEMHVVLNIQIEYQTKWFNESPIHFLTGLRIAKISQVICHAGNLCNQSTLTNIKATLILKLFLP